MNSKRLFVLICLCCSSIVLVASLFYYSEYRGAIPTGFKRMLPSKQLEALLVKKLAGTNLCFAGHYKDRVFVSSFQKKNELLDVNLTNLDTTTIRISAKKGLKVSRGADLSIQNRQIYLYDGQKGLIGTGRFIEKSLAESINTPFFTSASPLSYNSFLIRLVNQSRISFLAKFRSDLKTTIPNYHLLEKQVDGMFCTDGSLFCVPGKNIAFYVYHYRNQFLRIDTNLNLIYKGKTIDTNSRVKIEVKEIKSLNQLTLSKPPQYVNKQSCATEKYLFISSGIKAENETANTFKNSAVIDVYNVQNGKYKLSFYLPDFNGQKLTDFKVYGNTLVALFGPYLYTFRLNF